MAHLWSGRFAGDPDTELFEFGASFRFDRRLIADDVRGSRAWAAALANAGAISAADARAIDGGLAEIAERAEADPSFVTDSHGDEDVHAFVERELVSRVGDAGRRLHTGRSRNEQVAVDLRLYLKPRADRSAGARRAGAGALGPRRTRGRRVDAVVYAPAARAAGTGVAFPARTLRGASTRSRTAAVRPA